MFSSETEFKDAYDTIRTTFASGKSKSIAWRKWQLKQVWWMLEDYEDRILEALKKDLNKPAWESHITDIFALKQDVLYTLKNFQKWVREENIGGNMVNWMGGASVRKEPLGAVLIIGTWNFPFLVTLQPMLAAIAAGCTVMLKPSEVAPASQELMVEMIAKYMDQSAIRMITAGPAEMGRILEHKFDMIFYTGAPGVARIVAQAAAKYLTPTVLELGGQGPAIVTPSANVDLAAKRIAAAKFLNAGQICLSTNHAFVAPNGGKSWDQMCRIINERHFDRVSNLLEKSQGKVVYGGFRERCQKLIEPTVLVDIKMTDPIMSQELFAPILPVITAEVDEAIKHIQSGEHPLAVYIFSRDGEEIKHIIDNIQSGGITINDCMIHASVEGAPFGGVGEAGHGYYHGIYGVNTFSHLRTTINLPTWMDKLMSFRYPPYNLGNLNKLQLPKRPPFRRGETLEDQEAERGLWVWLRIPALVVVMCLLSIFVEVSSPRLWLHSPFRLSM